MHCAIQGLLGLLTVTFLVGIKILEISTQTSHSGSESNLDRTEIESVENGRLPSSPSIGAEAKGWKAKHERSH